MFNSFILINLAALGVKSNKKKLQIFWQENITGHPGEGGGVKHGTFRKSGLFSIDVVPYTGHKQRDMQQYPKKNSITCGRGEREIL